MRIGIVGAGHAGVEAARYISENGGEVVLYSDEPFLPYIRPRVVLLAFGRTDLDAIALRPQQWYDEHKIDLRLNCPVTEIDVHAKTVAAQGRQEKFDALILAAGAGPILLPIVSQFPKDIIPIWRAQDSLCIQKRLGDVRHLTIIGGGISGLEAAVYGREQGLDVMVVEKASWLMMQQFGSAAAGVLARRLANLGVRVKAGRFVTDVAKTDARLSLRLDDGEQIQSDLVLTTVGAARNVSLFAKAGLRTQRGVLVDQYQQTSVPGVFACGDIAERPNVRTGSILLAAEQGKGAAVNALATLAGRPLEPVPDRKVPLSFKHPSIEFHAVGTPPIQGFAEKLLSDGEESIYRSVVLDGEILRGVQMIGSREGFRELANSLDQPYRML
ncbi:MAG: NAD(P)/FAD-dependent oxidoreductase [Solirubrobacterales bacterium]